MIEDYTGRLWGLLVTYHRPDALAEMIKRVQRQTRRPDVLMIIDNGSDVSVEQAALAAGARYLDAGDNLGPAGGIALGMERILTEASDSDWIVLFDDDDPPRTDDMLERLLDFAARCQSEDPTTAGVGLAGARYNHRWGVFQRVSDDELKGKVKIDYLGGNQLPTYACGVLRRVGVFDRSLFFGFEEAEFGLRLSRQGYSLFVSGDLLRAERKFFGRLGRRGGRARSSNPAWRRYYSVRNAVLIARRHASPLACIVLAVAGAARGFGALARGRRPLKECLLPFKGGWDGLLGVTGRTVSPSSSGAQEGPAR